MSDSPLKNYWRKVQKKIDGLSLRERGLVLVTAVAVVYMLWDLVIFSPLAESKKMVDQNRSAIEQKKDALLQEEQTLLLTINSDPDRDLKLLRDGLNDRVKDLDNELGELSDGLIPVTELANILQKVLEQTEMLTFRGLQTLPVEAIEFAAVDSDSGSGDSDYDSRAGVYKHSVVLKVEGQYSQLLQYVKTLESLEWRFYWDELRFERNQYPVGTIYLKVYTLSTDEGLLGV